MFFTILSVIVHGLAYLALLGVILMFALVIWGAVKETTRGGPGGY